MPQTVTNIECLLVETRSHIAKEKVYSLAVTWSNGVTTQTEVLNSAVIEFRNRLQNDCYRNRNDVIIPEVPVISLIELAAVGRRDEKRRKLIQDFCEQILKLPYAADKERIISEFFSRNSVAKSATKSTASSTFYTEAVLRGQAPTSCSSNDEVHYSEWADNEIRSTDLNQNGKSPIYADIVKTRSSTASLEQTMTTDDVIQYADLQVREAPVTFKSPIYADIVKTRSSTASLGQTMTTDDVIQYADLQVRRAPVALAKKKSTTAQVPLSSSSPTEPLYAEVTPQTQRLRAARRPCDDVGSGQDMVDGCVTSSGPMYVNVDNIEVAYENMAVGKTSLNTSRRPFREVVQNYSPNTGHCQGLAVVAGDIVQVQSESGGRAYCLLCAKFPSVTTHPLEGWLPLSILSPVQPELVADAESPVPVYKTVDKSQPPVAKPRTKLTNIKTELSNDIDLLSDSLMLTSQDGNCSMTSCNMVPTVMSPSLELPDLKSSLQRLASCDTAAMQPVEPKSNYIRVMAIAGYDSPTAKTTCSDDDRSAVISFNYGDVGDLIYSSDSRWLCVRIGRRRGWVPTDYWCIFTEDGRVESFERAPWMVGQLDREECEQLLLKHGAQQDFVIRQSKNLAGQYALSIKHNDRLHHFPIIRTSEGRFYIGKHNFTTIDNIIIYYKRNTLFIDESACPVTLGSPLKRIP